MGLVLINRRVSSGTPFVFETLPQEIPGFFHMETLLEAICFVLEGQC